MELAGEARTALAPSFPGELSFDVEVPAEDPTLRFSIATASTKPAERARVTFRVVVESESESELESAPDEPPITVFRRELRSREHNLWHDAEVRLDAWAGKSVTLRLRTSPTRARLPVPWAGRIRTLWGDPRIAEGDGAPPPEEPSTILIVVDTLRYDYLGVNGFRGGVSPNLDWLALESTRFERAFSTAPWTKPSVASLLTGLHPQTHGVRDHAKKILPGATDALDESALTLAEVFERRGYETAAFVGNAWLGPAYGFDQGFETFVVEPNDDRLLSQASQWLASRGTDTAYFLYLHLIGVHAPYRAPESDYLALRESPSLGGERALTESDPRRPDHFGATPWAHPDEDQRLAAWKAKYAASVRRLDRRLGRFLGGLRDSGELDRVRVVFTSDHGEEFLEHGSWEHGYSLCDHQIRVPLWIREPGAPSAGLRVNEVVSLVDVMSTVLGSSSIPVPSRLDGVDRSGWIHEPPETLQGASAVSTGIMNRPDVYSLRTNRYHLLLDASSGAVRLFDVAEDPGEAVDLAARKSVMAANLRRILRFRLDRIASAGALDTETVPISEELREELRALGYIE